MGDGVIVIALILLTLAMSLTRCTLATTYLVGAGTCSYGWHYSCDYTSWAQFYSFVEGDNLVFEFIEGYNTVAQVTAPYYDACTRWTTNADPPRGCYSPWTVTLTSAGDYYFVSVYNGACFQKLAVSVAAASFTTPPAETVPSPHRYNNSSPRSPNNYDDSPPPASTTSTLKIKLVVGGSTTGVVLLVVYIILYCCFRRYKNQNQNQNQNQVVVKPEFNVGIGVGN